MSIKRETHSDRIAGERREGVGYTADTTTLRYIHVHISNLVLELGSSGK